MNHSDIADKIREIRDTTGQNTTAFAKSIGFEPIVLNNWIAKRSIPNPFNLELFLLKTGYSLSINGVRMTVAGIQKWIRAERERQNISGCRLSEMLGKKTCYIANVENIRISTKAIFEIPQVLGYEVEIIKK